jgi:hypothetical protein
MGCRKLTYHSKNSGLKLVLSKNGVTSINTFKKAHIALESRIYDAEVARWLSRDPLEAAYPQLSPYSFAANSPIIFIDEAGEYIRLSFESRRAYKAYVKLVNASLDGQFKVSFKLRTDDRLGYNFEVFLTPTGGDVSKLTDKGKAFYEQYSRAINAKEIVRQEVVYGDEGTDGGSWITNKIDIADAESHDEAGLGGRSGAGVVIHETIEQLKKAEFGLDPGEDSNIPTNKWETYYPPEYLESHDEAIESEMDVNGNVLIDEIYYSEPDGSYTKQHYTPGSKGKLKVDKIRLEY